MRKLSQILSFAINNPYSDFYRRKYGTDYARIIERPLPSIPLLTREEIDATPFFDRVFVPREMMRFVRATSGSSGRRVIGFPVLEEPELMRYRQSVGFNEDSDLAGRYFGPYFKKEDPYSLLMFSAASVIHEAHLQATDGMPVVVGDFHDPELSVRLGEEAKTDSIFSFPSPLVSILPHFEASSLRENIRFILLLGERLTALQRNKIADAFPRAQIATMYASTESQGMAAHTCPKRLREAPNHIHPFSTYAIELIDPETGALLEIDAGVEGEMVLTALVPMGFPLIRYRTGDYAVVHQVVPCVCGSTEPLMEILGRATLDKVKVPLGGISVAALEEAVYSLPHPVFDFSALWQDNGTLPSLSITLYTDASIHNSASTLAAALKVSSIHTYADLVEKGLVAPLTVELLSEAQTRMPNFNKRKRLHIAR